MMVIEAIYTYPYAQDAHCANVVGLLHDSEDSVEWINEWLKTQVFPMHRSPTLIKRYWFQDFGIWNFENRLGAYVFLVFHKEHDGQPDMWVEE